MGHPRSECGFQPDWFDPEPVKIPGGFRIPPGIFTDSRSDSVQKTRNSYKTLDGFWNSFRLETALSLSGPDVSKNQERGEIRPAGFAYWSKGGKSASPGPTPTPQGLAAAQYPARNQRLVSPRFVFGGSVFIGGSAGTDVRWKSGGIGKPTAAANAAKAVTTLAGLAGLDARTELRAYVLTWVRVRPNLGAARTSPRSRPTLRRRSRFPRWSRTCCAAGVATGGRSRRPRDGAPCPRRHARDEMWRCSGESGHLDRSGGRDIFGLHAPFHFGLAVFRFR